LDFSLGFYILLEDFGKMSIADIFISIIIWIIQSILLPILPTNLPFLSFDTFKGILGGTLKHNFIWGLAGLNIFLNLNLIFTLIGVIIFGEICFWGVKAGMFLWKSIRGSG